MKYRKTEVTVGLVSLTALLILISVTVNLKKSTLFSPKDRYQCYFKDAKRLEVGAAVYVHGVVRGEVISIEATGQKEYPVRVTISITKNTALHDGALPRIVTAGLLGESEIDIKDINPSAPRLIPEESKLYGTSFVDLSDLAGRIPAVLDNLEESVKAVSDILNDPGYREDITRILDSVSSVTVKLDQTLGASAGDLTEAVKNIRIASENLTGMMLRADAIMTSFGVDLTEAGSSLRTGIDEIRTSAGVLLAQVDSTAKQIRDAADRASSALKTAEEILSENRGDARRAVAGLTSASVHLGAIMSRVDSGDAAAAEILIGNNSYEDLQDSLRSMNESLEIIGRWLSGADQWITGSDGRSLQIEIPYDSIPKSKTEND